MQIENKTVDTAGDSSSTHQGYYSSAGWGVSVILCCHNSARRLPETLTHLAAQRVEQGLPWEVVVVDNASSDATSDVARATWPSEAPAPLRVVYEPKPGLSNARRRGVDQARYEIISFVDDDNWVCPDWVQLVVDTMDQHPEVGACGGLIEPVYEVTPPYWMENFVRRYAVGAQGETEGDITSSRGWLWGAGLTMRKSAWQCLANSGFRTLLLGREGAKLSAGEDVEICWALRLAGWRIWYNPRMRMRHFLPAGRLNWTYLRGLYYGFGAADLGLLPYQYALDEDSGGRLRQRLKRVWQMQAVMSLARLLRHGHKLALFPLRKPEGDADILQIDRDLARLLELLRQRGAYNRRIREIQDAPWARLRGGATHTQSHAHSSSRPVAAMNGGND